MNHQLYFLRRHCTVGLKFGKLTKLTLNNMWVPMQHFLGENCQTLMEDKLQWNMNFYALMEVKAFPLTLRGVMKKFTKNV